MRNKKDSISYSISYLRRELKAQITKEDLKVKLYFYLNLKLPRINHTSPLGLNLRPRLRLQHK